MTKNWWYSLGAGLFGSAYLFQAEFATALPLALALLLMAENCLRTDSSWQSHILWWGNSALFLALVTGAMLWQLPQMQTLDLLWHSLPLFLAMVAFRWIKISLGRQRGYIALPLLWVSAEALPLYLRQEPSLTYWGKALAESGNFERYSQYLGSLGSSLFLLAMGTVLFLILNAQRPSKKSKYIGVVLWLLFYSLGPLALPQPIDQGPETKIQAGSGEQLNTLPDQQDPRLIPSAKPVQIAPKDRFTARVSFFLAIFLMLFSLVKNIMNPQKEKNDRSTQ